MKILLLTFDEHEEKAIDKILTTISDCVSLEAVQTIPVPASGMSFPGLEIRQSQHRLSTGSRCLLFRYSKLFIKFPRNFAKFYLPCVVSSRGGVYAIPV